MIPSRTTFGRLLRPLGILTAPPARRSNAAGRGARWLLGAVLGCAPFAVGAAAIYDGFADAAPGTTLPGLNGGSGWGGAWGWPGSGLDVVVSTPGLDFPGLKTAPHAARAAAPGGTAVAYYFRGLPAPLPDTGAPLYLSVLLRPELGFDASAVTAYGGINLGPLFIGMSGNNALNYALEGPAVGDIDSSTVMAVAGQTVLLVVEALLQAGNDQLALFVNPTPGAPLPASADAVKTNLNLAGGVDLFLNTSGGFSIDEIRIGASAADVLPTGGALPAPGVAWLLIAGLLLLRCRGAR